MHGKVSVFETGKMISQGTEKPEQADHDLRYVPQRLIKAGQLAESGCNVMVSNANDEAIVRLYRNTAKEIIPLRADRMINSVGNQRTGYSELVILSYTPEEKTLKAWMHD